MATTTADERRAPFVGDGLAVVAIGLAAILTVFALLPSEGVLGAAFHEALGALLGRSVFVLPLSLVLGGALRLAHLPLPRARLIGLAMLAVTVLAADHMLVQGDAGLLGRWLAESIIGALGSVGAVTAVLAALVAGAVLTFGVRVGPK